MRKIAVILAGGTGNRLNYTIPKQFIKVAGKKIIEHTISIFDNHDLIDEICIVCNKDYIYTMENIIIEKKYRKVSKILVGGKERYESSLSAINAYDDQNKEKILIFHDAVRPLVSNDIINKCINALATYNAVDVAIKTTDTIINVRNDNIINSIPDRRTLYNGQTPQGFKFTTIKKAYELALRDKNFTTTDDCGVVKKYLPKTQIYVVEGALNNIKVTYQEDIFLLDKLFQIKTMEKNSFSLVNYNQLKSSVIVIFGGSSGIGKSIYELLKKNGVTVYEYSRSTKHINISCKADVKQALKDVYDKEKK